MICGASPKKKKHRLPESNQLCCHEIANGPLRQAALDQPYAILVLCFHCNQSEVMDKANWPQARQLAVLKTFSPEHYDLQAFNFLVNPNAPNRITQEEVDEWIESSKRSSRSGTRPRGEPRSSDNRHQRSV